MSLILSLVPDQHLLEKYGYTAKLMSSYGIILTERENVLEISMDDSQRDVMKNLRNSLNVLQSKPNPNLKDTLMVICIVEHAITAAMIMNVRVRESERTRIREIANLLSLLREMQHQSNAIMLVSRKNLKEGVALSLEGRSFMLDLLSKGLWNSSWDEIGERGFIMLDWLTIADEETSQIDFGGVKVNTMLSVTNLDASRIEMNAAMMIILADLLQNEGVFRSKRSKGYSVGQLQLVANIARALDRIEPHKSVDVRYLRSHLKHFKAKLVKKGN